MFACNLKYRLESKWGQVSLLLHNSFTRVAVFFSLIILLSELAQVACAFLSYGLASSPPPQPKLL